jgi:hypothetical protein
VTCFICLTFGLSSFWLLEKISTYQDALVKLAQTKQFKYINEIMKNVSLILPDDEWNKLILMVIRSTS